MKNLSDSTAEAGALACVLCTDAPQKLLEQLEPADFYDLRNVAVFRALVTLEEDRAPLDTVSVVQHLKAQGDLERAGGFQYVSVLPDQTPSAANFSSFLRVLRDLSQRRKMVADAEALRTKAMDLARPVEANDARSIHARLIDREFQFARKPEDVPAVFTLCGQAVCTPGNLTSVVSQAKTGKSAVVGAMLAAVMTPDASGADLLGFSSSNPQSKTLLHFDTEQSPFDAWQVVARALRRARIEDQPKWLRSFCLTGLLPQECFAYVREGIALAKQNAPGLHSVHIDGVADLVHDVNDSGECNDAVARLHGLAIEHNCPIICVLHFNPDSAKARGHLGSQLERKAESNLRLDKEEEATVLWSNKQRRATIARDFGPRFTWNDEAGMHLQIENRSTARRGAKAEAAIPERDDVFHERPAMRYSDLVAAIILVSKCSERTAKRRIDEWRRLGVIEKSVANLWTPKD